MIPLEKNNIPVGYKDSAVGIIPQEWEVKFFKDVCTFLNGRAYKQEELLSQGKYPVLRVGNFFTNTNWYYSDLELDKDKYAVEGDLLYAWSASFGPRFWNGEKVIYHYHIWKVVISSIIDKLFLYDYLEMDARKLYNQIQGGTMAHITKGGMEQRYIPVPPMEEQRKIAEILGVWDEAIEKQSRLIEKLELRKRALMQRLLTGRTRLPGFTTPWQKVSYYEILKEVKRNMTWDDNEEYDLISVKRRSGGLFHRDRLLGKDIKTKNLRPAKLGDFLISKMQIVHGASGLVTEEFDGMKISGSYIALVAKSREKVDMNFINWYSQTPYFYHQTYVSSYGVHIEKMTFDLESFMSMNIMLPPLLEQKAIAEVLTAANNEIATHRKKLDALRLQKRGLMQQLLTGKTRVKI